MNLSTADVDETEEDSMFQYVFGLNAERQAYSGQLYFGEEFFGQGADSLEEDRKSVV